MKRGGPIKRKTRLRPVNPERARRREAKAFGAKGAFVRTLYCLSCWAAPPSDAAHVKSRGSGGDSSSLVPLCRLCHVKQHANGWSALGAPREWWMARAEALEIRWQELERAA